MPDPSQSAAPERIMPITADALSRAWADALADCYEALIRETGIGVDLLTPQPEYGSVPVGVLRSPGPGEYTG